jgi:hypothetical protein
MSDLYIENFFHPSPTSTLEPQDKKPATASLAVLNEESVNQAHFFFRVLSEEVNKLLKNEPPFPLVLKNIESTILYQNKEKTLELLEDLEELIDIKYLATSYT